jgi:hypothetical protein
MLCPWQPPQPESGFVVDVHFYDPEVVCVPFRSARAASRFALRMCEGVNLTVVLGVKSVAIYSADLVRECRAAADVVRYDRFLQETTAVISGLPHGQP